MEYSMWAWMKIDCYVTNFNEHQAKTYTPSDQVCVDKSISKWNGLGGFWINKGLSHSVAMERKPEDGCEIQTCCDARSGIMMQVLLVKGKVHETDDEETDSIPHGTAVMLKLLKPWLNDQGTPSLVCGG
jgi:hypothetical protein